MKVRPYCESDLEAVAYLFTESVHHVAKAYYYPSQRVLTWAVSVLFELALVKSLAAVILALFPIVIGLILAGVP